MLIIFTSALVACDGPEETAIPTGQSVTIELGRLDHALFRAPPDSMAAASLKAYATFGEFYRIYIEDILQGAPIRDPRLPMVLHRFVLDPDWREAQRAVDSVLGDLEPQRVLFEKAFSRLKALFPDSLTPRVVVFNSGYNYGIFPTDSVLGIGAEWFIGAEHPVIGYLAPESFPQYVKARMEPDMLVPGAVKGWLLVHYTRDVQGADLLNHLVETGKVMALLDALLPEVSLSLKMAFGREQLDWCERNEYEIWKQLVSGEQLYSKKPEDIGRWMNDGPFTNGLPRESPGHLGEWIGYRMVKSYLKANPKLTFAQLLPMEDSREILKSYKPR
ncbi:MAG: hypothetical protein IPM46_07620 [Flavobacteriales bacterium]|nr:hypothetical protein [Flavobacteriales bacterium]